MAGRVWRWALLGCLLLPTPGWAQGPGLWQVGPGTARTLCADLTSPVANQTWCADGNPPYAWRVWDGTQYVSITGVGTLTGSGATTQQAYWTGTSTLAGSPSWLFSPILGLDILPIANPLPTKAAVSLSQFDQATSSRQFLTHLGLVAQQGSADTVTLYLGLDKQSGASDVWSLNSVLTMQPGSGTYNAIGYELDFNNMVGHRGDLDAGFGLAPPAAYGLAVTGASSFRSTAAVLIAGPGTGIWNRGIVIANDAISATGSAFQDLGASHDKSIDIRGAPTWGIYQSATVDTTSNWLNAGVILGPVPTGLLPPPGQLGRVLFDATTNTLKCDNGVSWNPCNGTGSVTGTGTTNVIVKWTNGAGGIIGDSHLDDTGSLITLGGPAVTLGVSTSFTVPAQAATSGHSCVQIDSAGLVTKTGAPCGAGASGEVSLSGTTTTVAVVLPMTQPDTTYAVALGTRPVSGTPPAVLAWYKNKTTTGFDVEITAPPGSGNTVGVSWQVGSGTPGTGITGSGTPGNLMAWAASNAATDFAGAACPGGEFATAIGATGALTCAAGGGGTVTRTCTVIVGADNSGIPLVDGDLGPQRNQCFVPAAGTILEVRVAANDGTPAVLPAKNTGGTTTSLLSGELATAASGGVACANAGGGAGIGGSPTCSATLTTTALAAGDWIEFTSGTAGGVATRMSIVVTYTVP